MRHLTKKSTFKSSDGDQAIGRDAMKGGHIDATLSARLRAGKVYIKLLWRSKDVEIFSRNWFGRNPARKPPGMERKPVK